MSGHDQDTISVLYPPNKLLYIGGNSYCEHCVCTFVIETWGAVGLHVGTFHICRTLRSISGANLLSRLKSVK